jgi:hypothetical protein
MVHVEEMNFWTSVLICLYTSSYRNSTSFFLFLQHNGLLQRIVHAVRCVIHVATKLTLLAVESKSVFARPTSSGRRQPTLPCGSDFLTFIRSIE